VDSFENVRPLLRKKGTNKQALLATCFTLASCLAYSSTLKIEATCSSETSVDFQWTTRRYIPENRTLQNRRCENLRSHKQTNQQTNKQTMESIQLPKPMEMPVPTRVSVVIFVLHKMQRVRPPFIHSEGQQ
jgi:hypothetical protein